MKKLLLSIDGLDSNFVSKIKNIDASVLQKTLLASIAVGTVLDNTNKNIIKEYLTDYSKSKNISIDKLSSNDACVKYVYLDFINTSYKLDSILDSDAAASTIRKNYTGKNDTLLNRVINSCINEVSKRNNISVDNLLKTDKYDKDIISQINKSSIGLNYLKLGGYCNISDSTYIIDNVLIGGLSNGK